MSNFRQTVKRVVRSYNIEEKVLSVVLALVFVVSFINFGVELFKTPEFFLSGAGIYSEGVVSEKSILLNPLYVDFSEASRDVSSLVFSGLTKYDPDIKAFKGDLADLTVSEDKLTYRFLLKDKLYWHDGVPLTADDVYFTFHDVIQSPDFQNPVLRANFEGVEVRKIDERTVEFVLKKPNSFFITNCGVGILPAHILRDIAVFDLPYDVFNLKPIGSGPYKVDSAMEVIGDGRQRVLLTAFSDYYGDLPKIKNIRFNIYPNAEALIKETGALNIIPKVSTEIDAGISKTNRFTSLTYELPQYTAVFFNMDSTVLKKEKVRLALQKSIDKIELLKILPNKVDVETPLLELNQADYLIKPDLEQAKAALYDSGYKLIKDSTDPIRKDGKDANLKLILLARQYEAGSQMSTETSSVTDFLKKAWLNIGVELDVQLVDSMTFADRLQKRDYDMVLAGQSLGYNNDTYSFWHSSQATEAGLNLSNFRIFAVDALIERIRDTFDVEIRGKLVKDLASEIARQIPAVFLYRPVYVFATDSKVKGIELKNLSFMSDRFAHMDRWCVSCQ